MEKEPHPQTLNFNPVIALIGACLSATRCAALLAAWSGGDRSATSGREWAAARAGLLRELGTG